MKKILILLSAAVLLTACGENGEDNIRRETLSDNIPETAAETSAEVNDTSETDSTVSEKTTAEETLSETAIPDDTAAVSEEETNTAIALPVDENVAKVVSVLNDDDVLFFGHIFFESNIDKCGVLFVTADGRAYGGICGYMGDFRNSSYMDYLGAVSDVQEFGVLPKRDRDYLVKYAISTETEHDFEEWEATPDVPYTSWYECISYNTSHEPLKILAYAEEWGYGYISKDINALSASAIINGNGVIDKWKEYCETNLGEAGSEIS